MFFRSVTIHSKKGSIVALLAPKFKKNEILNVKILEIKDEKIRFSKRALEKEIQENASGEENAGTTMILYSMGKENSAEVISLSGNDLKDRYLALSQDNRNNIILAHSVTTPILFGIKTEGSLGNATELEIGYKIMKANYFKYKQRAILQALNHIAKYANGLQGEITFNEVELDFLQAKEEETPAIFSKKKFESYTDYPEGARNNARRAIEWKEKNGSDCGTQVGWVRARQLADGKPISEETISLLIVERWGILYSLES